MISPVRSHDHEGSPGSNEYSGGKDLLKK